MLGISEDRVLQHIKAARLPARKVNGRYMIRKESVEHFRHHPPGRMRTRAPEWRTYHARSRLLTMDIRVPLRPGRHEALDQRLAAIRQAQRHTFPGVMARYVLKDAEDSHTLRIWLIWKDTEITDQTALHQHLSSFQAELADVLDWEHAETTIREGIIYT